MMLMMRMMMVWFSALVLSSLSEKVLVSNHIRKRSGAGVEVLVSGCSESSMRMRLFGA